MDSDDDGISDKDETVGSNYWYSDYDGDGKINAVDPDSDDDELYDGLERGYRTGNASLDTDLFRSYFVPDLDRCVTDPYDNDTDDDNIKDGTEDANHNGGIDGDNGDGKWSDSETWTELDPNQEDTDGDTFNDDDEIEWDYNPLAKDTDGDGLDDNEEDTSNYGTWDSSTETNVLESDTDVDGLSDGMEIDGWTVIIIYEATLEVKEEREVTSNPLISDDDEDGISDSEEFENGTDPNDDDSDDDGFDDKEEIDFDCDSSPTGIDGKPPTITDIDSDYELIQDISGKLNDLKISYYYVVNIYISAEDLFGIEWINVYLDDIGELRYNTNGLNSINKMKYKFKIDYNQAIKSLFNRIDVNITANDMNYNLGFINKNIPSIAEKIFQSLFGILQLTINLNIQLAKFAFQQIFNHLKNKINTDLFMLETNINELNKTIEYGKLNIQKGVDRLLLICKYIENILNPFYTIIDGIREKLEEAFLYPASILIKPFSALVNVDVAISLKENIENCIDIFNNLFMNLIDDIENDIIKNICNILLRILNSLYHVGQDILSFIKESAQEIVHMLVKIDDLTDDYIFDESTKSKSEEKFSRSWEAATVASMILDLILALSSVVLGFATSEGTAGVSIPIGIAGGIAGILAFAIDAFCYDFFWSNIIIGDGNVYDDSIKELTYHRVLFPLEGFCAAYEAGIPINIVTQDVFAWIQIVCDSLSLGFGIGFFCAIRNERGQLV